MAGQQGDGGAVHAQRAGAVEKQVSEGGVVEGLDEFEKVPGGALHKGVVAGAGFGGGQRSFEHTVEPFGDVKGAFEPQENTGAEHRIEKGRGVADQKMPRPAVGGAGVAEVAGDVVLLRERRVARALGDQRAAGDAPGEHLGVGDFVAALHVFGHLGVQHHADAHAVLVDGDHPEPALVAQHHADLVVAQGVVAVDVFEVAEVGDFLERGVFEVAPLFEVPADHGALARGVDQVLRGKRAGGGLHRHVAVGEPQDRLDACIGE